MYIVLLNAVVFGYNRHLKLSESDNTVSAYCISKLLLWENDYTHALEADLPILRFYPRASRMWTNKYGCRFTNPNSHIWHSIL